MKVDAITPEFVDHVPDEKQYGVLYISMRFATAIHLCCCGCGNPVVTPLSPADWRMTFDGETVSLQPSIGNWAFPCQSHYWITENKVRWAPRWSARQIEAGRARDRIALERHFNADRTSKTARKPDVRPEKQWGLWKRVRGWWPR
jgi:hypothetical protein